MMTKVVLHGKLGRAVGQRIWHLIVKSPGEALRAIEANCGKLFDYILKEQDGKAPYRVLIDGKDFKDHAELSLPIKHYRTIHFIPVVGGAGSEIFQIVVGVILIAAAVLLAFFPPTSLASPFVISLGIGILFSVGASLLLGGITALLSPSPNNKKLDDKQENTASYLFGGAVNTIKQGNPVQIGYGRLRIGSQVISVRLTSTDIPVA